MTAYGDSALRKLCPRLAREAGLESRAEVEARFGHCQRAIAWDRVQDATVAGGDPTGDAAPGCDASVAELEPIRMRVKTADGIFTVDLFQPVARDGEVLGVSGALKCTRLSEARYLSP